MSELKFKATNTKTGKVAIFTFNDLYGYEGEVRGVFIHGTGVLVYNDDNPGCEAGLNPDLQIELYTED